LEGGQRLFRKFAGMVKVPENMLFTGGKIIGAFVFTIIFFLIIIKYSLINF
jgi:hypothetical protein